MCLKIIKYIVLPLLLIYCVITVYAFVKDKENGIDSYRSDLPIKSVDISLGISGTTAFLIFGMLLCCLCGGKITVITCCVVYIIFGSTQIIPFIFDCFAVYNQCQNVGCFVVETIKYGIILFHLAVSILVSIGGVIYLVIHKCICKTCVEASIV